MINASDFYFISQRAFSVGVTVKESYIIIILIMMLYNFVCSCIHNIGRSSRKCLVGQKRTISEFLVSTDTDSEKTFSYKYYTDNTHLPLYKLYRCDS